MHVQTQERRTFRRCCTHPKMTQNHKAQVQFNKIWPNLNYKDGGRHLAIAGAMGSEHYLGQKRTKPPFSLKNSSSTFQNPHFLHPRPPLKPTQFPLKFHSTKNPLPILLPFPISTIKIPFHHLPL